MSHAWSGARRQLALAAACAMVLGAVVGCGSGEATPKPSTTSSKAAVEKRVKVVDASTFTTVEGAPRDASTKKTDGTVVHPKSKQPVYDEPGGTAIARLPVKELGNPTWVPVIDRKSGWLKVLLPARPNGAAGWLRSSAQLDKAKTPYVVKVDVDKRRLVLRKDDALVGSWQVAVGATKTPTPRTRTYLMASIIDAKQAKYTPLVLPLGAHSDTLDTFGGGPGTVALHGWSTDSSVFGQAVSNGCIRVPADGLDELRQVPLGSLVLIQ
ncbi:MAG: L,D-transpeptidase family protein [Streptosporangiales bacterium]|nr:L,D-transpeptidase family protein [Streptosporangiales bacterium]